MTWHSSTWRIVRTHLGGTVRLNHAKEIPDHDAQSLWPELARQTILSESATVHSSTCEERKNNHNLECPWTNNIFRTGGGKKLKKINKSESSLSWRKQKYNNKYRKKKKDFLYWHLFFVWQQNSVVNINISKRDPLVWQETMDGTKCRRMWALGMNLSSSMLIFFILMKWSISTVGILLHTSQY